MKTKNKIKAFLTINDILINDMAILMSEKGNKKYTADSLGGKIRRESITFKEAEFMADLLGYDLNFVKR